jgi:L-rhamnose mutarotase
MKRICFTLQISADRVEEYKKAHANVWPEMREALKRNGWHNYSLFVRADGLLVGYFETPDFNAAIANMQREPVNAKWQAAMKPLFEGLETAAADTSMRPLENVFFLP